MKQVPIEAKRKQRTFLLLLPFVVAPFLVVLFWLLGGGKGTADASDHARGQLNTELPAASLSTEAIDKLRFYEMAAQDSVKQAELRKLDPVIVQEEEDVVEAVREKAERVRAFVEQPVARYTDQPPVYAQPASPDLDRMQEMVKGMQQRKPDPEMEALNGTLEKLVALQKPASAEVVKAVKEREALAVRLSEGAAGEGFYGESGVFADTMVAGAIQVVVHGTQTVQNGSIIKLRLTRDVYLKAQRIAAGSFLFGSVSQENERLRIAISHIRYHDQLYPVALTALDIDGMEGIYIPGSIVREVAKQSADQGIQSVGLISVDASLKAQATAAGIGAAKGLLARKVRQLRVTVTSGYRLILRDETRREQP